jgi:saccharopine dehydrogenase-like NADP-dependent oxidoreductase
MKMKIIIFGAAGVQGKASLVYLLEQKDVTEVKITDIRENVLNEIVDQFRDKRVVANYLDLADHSAIVKECKGYDIAINCSITVGYFMTATKGALEAGTSYLDLTTMGEREAQQTLHDEFKKKNIVCIQDMGVGPGLSNIAAAYLMSKLDKTDTIDIKFVTIDTVPPEEHSKPLNCTIALGGHMYLLSGPTYVYEDGILKELEPRARPEKFTFAEPIGTQTIHGLPHSEPVIMSRTFADKGIKRISVWGSQGDDLEQKLCFLQDLGFANLDPIDVKGQKIVPFDVLEALVNNLPPETKKTPNFIGDFLIIVAGEKDGKKIEYTLRAVASPELYHKMREKGCVGQYRAGICGAVAAVMIGRGQILGKGVLEPEQAVAPEEFFKELSKFGYLIEIIKKSLM